MNNVVNFVGVDPADAYARSPRPWDVAVLNTALGCTFFQWQYQPFSEGILPRKVAGEPWVLAVDGPQGLAAEPHDRGRECERSLHTPGRVGFNMPIPGPPYAGFMRSSVEFFYRFCQRNKSAKLLGTNGLTPRDANLLEVYPGAAWTILAKGLPKKRSKAGREVRRQLLEDRGVRFPREGLPSHDMLDAALAAWTAYRFATGAATWVGRPPFWDRGTGVLREGFIVQP